MKNYFLIFILTLTSMSLHGQIFTLSGVVEDKSNSDKLIGVNVYIKGTTTGTTTSVDGKYSISVKNGDLVVFSYVGYINQEILISNQTNLDITLEEDIQSIDGVVVIGYGRVKKSDLTGSVSSVRGKDLQSIPSASPEQALQGKVAGVRVTSNSGAPGSAPTVRIRGVGTFGNPDPIFVVDGVILDDITFLNSGDIESMEILKDASATAMYGSRGANGVIIITTKSGSLGSKPIVNFSSGFDVQTIQKYIEMANARQFAIAVNQVIPGTFNNLDLLQNTDWQRAVYRNYAPLMNYQLSVNGGGKTTGYYFGVGYFNQEGVIPKSSYERITIKSNNKYVLSDHFQFGHNLTFSKYKKHDAAGVVASTLRAWPTDSPFSAPGVFNANRGNGNPLASIEYNNNLTDGIRTVGNFFGEARFLNDFTFRSSFGLDLEFADAMHFTPVFFVSPQQQNTESRISKNRSSRENWLWENTLKFNKTIRDHQFDILVGYTAQQDESEGLSALGKNLLRDNILYVSNSLTDIIIGNPAFKKSMISYLFRLNYVYRERYLFTATFRRDGSSVFAAANRWGNFPSLAAGWKISEEPFFKKGIVSNLKLRGSWGIVGNDKVDATERFTLISNDQGAVFGTPEFFNPGSTYGTSGNPLIRWEEAMQSNIGLEAGLFDSKLTAEFDYYHKMTKDILIDLPLPGHFGNGSFAFVKFNAADVLNRGIEVNINWKDNFGSLFYEFGVVGSTVHNEVVRMGKDTGADNFLPLGSLGNGQNVKRVAVGKPIGYFYGYKVDGIFQNTGELDMYPRLSSQHVGDFRYKDINGDGQITTADMTNIGNPIPSLTYGFNGSVSYKGFTLSFDFQGESGKNIYDGKDAVRAGQYNYQVKIKDAWDGEGSSTTEPRVTAGGVNYSQSDWFVYNGSFFRLRNLTISYDLPKSILAPVKIQGANVYLRGTNVFTLSSYPGYTPEIGGSITNAGIDFGVYPVTSVYGIGLKLTF